MRNNSIDLWNNQSSTLDLYLLEGDIKRPIVLVFPGGGYDHLSNAEGQPVAIAFNALGYHAAVLKYRFKPSSHEMPLEDAARAIDFLRSHSDLYNIVSDKIVVCGFSAGGHLAASISCLSSQTYGEASRPNAAILCYPVISMLSSPHEGSAKYLLGKDDTPELRERYSLEMQVHDQVPPSFIWHTIDDASVSYEHSLAYFNALTSHGVQTELHLFSHGAHGLSLASEVENNNRGSDALRVGQWFKLCETWLRDLFH